MAKDDAVDRAHRPGLRRPKQPPRDREVLGEAVDLEQRGQLMRHAAGRRASLAVGRSARAAATASAGRRRRSGQRGAKRQPGGRSTGLGHGARDRRQPLEVARRRAAACERSRPCGVGMARAASNSASTGAALDDAAGIHHDHASAISATTPRSWVISSIAMPQLALQLAQQVEDLRLDRDVERRGRLVGDQQLRARRPAPWRSSPAGACRRTAGADRRRRRSRGRGDADQRQQLARRASRAALRAGRAGAAAARRSGGRW